MATATVPPPLSQGTGYGVIVGLAVAFAIGEQSNIFSMDSFD
jgi:hypothetical protein